MTKEQIKARVCELFEFGSDKWFDYEAEFMTLAAEIAAAERKACAKLVESRRSGYDINYMHTAKVAEAIRAL